MMSDFVKPLMNIHAISCKFVADTVYRIRFTVYDSFCHDISVEFLADRTNVRAYATVLRLSSSSVTLCIVAKRCVLEQKLLLRAYRKSYMRNRLVPK